MDSNKKIPTIIVAGISSNSGKTTISVLLTLLFKKLNLKVAAFKCGPDYLDPTYHKRASGAESYNLDSWIMGKDALIDTFVSATEGADIAIIEGVMGLYDGASPTSEIGSTAQIAKWLNAPILLVLDASGMARSFAALALGFQSFDPDLEFIGLVANKVGSQSHLALLKKSLKGSSLLFGLPKNSDFHFPERHLGLETAGNSSSTEKSFMALEAVSKEWFDPEILLEKLASLPNNPIDDIISRPIFPVKDCSSVTIAIAKDLAFSFYYPYNLDLLKSLGATLVEFSPIEDKSLPDDIDGLILGGGYPELYAELLSQNHNMMESIKSFYLSDGPIYAECGGFIYLCETLIDRYNNEYSFCGLISGSVKMESKLQSLGYVEVQLLKDSILGDRGLRFRGHQFRYSNFINNSAAEEDALSVRKKRNQKVSIEGIQQKNLLASYIHGHFASNETMAQNLIKHCARYQGNRK